MQDYTILIIGVAYTGLGTYSLWSYKKKLDRFHIEGYELIAIITEISGSSDYEKAFITYTAAGKEHTVELGYYSRSMRVGDKVKIYVNYANPQDYIYVGKGPVVLCSLFIITGIVVIITNWQCIIR